MTRTESFPHSQPSITLQACSVLLQHALFVHIHVYLIVYNQVTLATIGTYVQVHRNDPDNRLTAERAFVTLSLFNILRFPVYMLPQIISSLVEVRSVCRVRMAIVGIQNQLEIKEDSTI